MANLKYKVNDATESRSIQAERLTAGAGGHVRATCDGESVEVEFVRTSPGCGWLLHQGRVVAFHAVKSEAGAEVWIDGRRLRLTEVKPQARRSGGEQAGGPVDNIAAPMPGTILKINLAAGESFVAHQPLIVMESMKMEMTLSSPHAGVMKEIRCKVGELVAMGAVLARLDATAESAKLSQGSPSSSPLGKGG